MNSSKGIDIMCSVRKVNDLLGEKIKMESVEVKELSFAYENTDTLILKNLNMQIQEGDFVCLLGQSGCGKSTLLRLLAGLEKPTNGEILIDGKPIKGASLERSVVFQDYGLFPWMTAGENIVLALKQKFPKQKKSELKAIAKEMLVKVGLDESVYGKLPKELSGGMKQRCAIARSFSINPPVLLMDEPFGALDAVTRARLQEMVLDLQYIGSGTDLTMFAGYMITGCMPIIAKKGTTWNGVEDMVGKTVACEPNVFAVSGALLDKGYDPLNDVKWLSLDNHTDRIEAVRSGEADYAVLGTGMMYNVTQMDDIDIVSYCSDVTPNYSCCRVEANTK